MTVLEEKTVVAEQFKVPLTVDPRLKGMFERRIQRDKDEDAAELLIDIFHDAAKAVSAAEREDRDRTERVFRADLAAELLDFLLHDHHDFTFPLTRVELWRAIFYGWLSASDFETETRLARKFPHISPNSKQQYDALRTCLEGVLNNADSAASEITRMSALRKTARVLSNWYSWQIEKTLVFMLARWIAHRSPIEELSFIGSVLGNLPEEGEGSQLMGPLVGRLAVEAKGVADAVLLLTRFLMGHHHCGVHAELTGLKSAVLNIDLHAHNLETYNLVAAHQTTVGLHLRLVNEWFKTEGASHPDFEVNMIYTIHPPKGYEEEHQPRVYKSGIGFNA